MTNDIFEGVADTLFIPLAARVEISKRFPGYFYDEKALAIGNAEAIRKIAKKVPNIPWLPPWRVLPAPAAFMPSLAASLSLQDRKSPPGHGSP
jgi:O-methyltransferase involved in polyketide biosynthesis